MKKRLPVPVLLVVAAIVACLLLGVVDLARRVAALMLPARPTPTRTLTPRPTYTPTTVPTQTPTPIPLQASAWEGRTVHVLHLEVDESYPSIEPPPDEGITEAVQRILTKMGVRVAPPDEPADATLTLQVTLDALGATYIDVGRCYTGATADSQLTVTAEGREPLVWSAHAECPPPSGMLASTCVLTPAEAPFDCAWSRAVLDNLSRLWGVPLLIQALGEEGTEIKIAASQVLGEMGTEAVEAVPALLRAKLGEFSSVRNAVSETLALMPNELIVPKLVEALQDPDAELRAAAAEELWWHQASSPEAVQAMIRALRDPDPVVRFFSAIGLGNAGPAATVAVPALIDALADEDPGVQSNVLDALRAITGQDFGEDAGRWKEWWDSQVGG